MNNQRIICTKIPRLKEAITLIDYLVARFTYRDRESWQKVVEEGQIIVDAKIANSSYFLQEGQTISYYPGEIAEPEVDVDFSIVYEDDRILLVDKPFNLPIHPAGRYFKHTLWYLLRNKYGAPLHPINRLDRETGGLSLWAKNPATAAFLASPAAQAVKKYLVLVEGVFPEELSADGFIFRDMASPVRKKRKFSQNRPTNIPNESCHTSFRRLSVANNISLLEARLFTGRTHQIRAVCHSLGFPVVGDKLYGVDENYFLLQCSGKLGEAERAKLILPNQALFCAELTFFAPESENLMSFSLEKPVAWEVIT